MTIWDEIDTSRKKERSSFEDYRGSWRSAWGVSPELGTFVEFNEMEDNARKAMEEYLSTPTGMVTRSTELGACDAILKYLIFNSHDLDRCGERSISQRLGIPRSRLHKLLWNMEWNGVIESTGIGTSSPYTVRDLGRAMKEGYLRIGPAEAEKLVKIVPVFEPLKRLVSESLLPSLPEPRHFSEASIRIMTRLHNPDKADRLLQYVHTPFLPGQMAYYAIGYTDHVIASLFFDMPFTGRLGELVKDVLMELDMPEEATDEDLERALCRVAEKQLKLARLYIKPMLDSLEEHGFEEGRKRIDKAYLRDKLLSQEWDSGGRRLLRYSTHIEEELVENRAIIPGHGLVTQQTQEVTPSLIRIVANVYKAACNFAEQAGGDPKLVESCRSEASRLESFVSQEPDRAPEVEEGEALPSGKESS